MLPIMDGATEARALGWSVRTSAFINGQLSQLSTCKAGLRRSLSDAERQVWMMYYVWRKGLVNSTPLVPCPSLLGGYQPGTLRQ